jgi:hypothetical protein
MTMPAFCLIAASFTPVAAEGDDQVTVKAEVISPSIVQWQASIRLDGSMRGSITEGTAETPFSVKQLRDADLQRIRHLARCIVSLPKVDLGGCPIAQLMEWPTAARLYVRVGDASRKSDGCIQGLTTDVGPAGRPSLELLLAIQRLLPKSKAFDLRAIVMPVLRQLSWPASCQVPPS